MIKALSLRGRVCPVIVCDVCGQRITGKRRGLAVWDADRPQDGYKHVHVGGCDLSIDPDGQLFCHDIDAHVIYLKRNLGITVREWEAAEHRAGQLEVG
jgi:hypothetical protein